MSTETKRESIKLEDRTVAIDPAHWPVVAKVGDSHECGQYAQNGSKAWKVRVRQHADGRTLVYLRTAGSCQCDLPETTGSGYLLSVADRASLRSSARPLLELGAASIGEDGHEYIEECLRQLMQDMPPEVLP
jgi:hypothetical protein